MRKRNRNSNKALPILEPLESRTVPSNAHLFGTADNNVLTGGAGNDIFFGAKNQNSIIEWTPGVNVVPPVVPPPNIFDDPFLGLTPTLPLTLTTVEVDALLQRASAATPSQDAIIAIVDRQGRPLGIRIEDNVNQNILQNVDTAVFAIDGALAKARAAAFFASNEAPLTSRTAQNISETTVSQREVESNPNINDPNSTLRGPGLVAPIGLGNHFPNGAPFNPQVDLFGIETTNRDSVFAVGPDDIKGTADDIRLLERFNIDPDFYNPNIPVGQRLSAPESYGFFSGLKQNTQGRGIGTLPGGVPIYKLNDPNNAAAGITLVGGIGVFFPGNTGFANEENSVLSTDFDPNQPDRSLEAEFVGFAATGGLPGLGFGIGNLGGVALPPTLSPQPGDLNNPPRIDLVGLTLDVFGPQGLNGPQILIDLGQQLGQGVVNGQLAPLIDPGPNGRVDVGIAGNDDGANPIFLRDGTPVPEGWIVMPHDDTTTAGGLTTQDVQQMTFHAVQQALQTRAAIRLPQNAFANFVISVTNPNGELLGLFRMPDATVFSVQVATSKARNVGYYADPNALQPQDMLPGVPAGTAFTNRTFRFLALPRFPEGIDGAPPGPFSQLNDDPGIDRTTPFLIDPSTGNFPPGTKSRDVRGTGLQNGPTAPASQFQSVFGFDTFNPGTNFRDQRDNNARDLQVDGAAFFQNPLLNRSGITFFPGSAPLYKNGLLVGGFGISGDGVDQDDVVTFGGSFGFDTSNGTNVQKIDDFVVGGVRLPFQKFNRLPNIFGFQPNALNGSLTFDGQGLNDRDIIDINAPINLNQPGADLKINTESILFNGSLTITTADDQFYNGDAVLNSDTTLIGDEIQLNGAVDLGRNNLTVNTTSKNSRAKDVISGSGDVIKEGPGTFTLAAKNTFSGTATVNGGTLTVNGELVNANVIVNNGGTLGGNGNVRHNVNVGPGGRVAPGTSTGILGAGNLFLGGGANFDVEINGSTPGTEHDRLDVTGVVHLSNATLNLTGTGIHTRGQIVIINNDGNDPVIGTFAGLPEGATITGFLGSKRNATITYQGGDGNDIVIDLGQASRRLVQPVPQGQPSLVQIFDDDGNELFQITPYDSFFGGVHVATGDVNGDGVDDIITGAGPGGGPHVKVFDGVDGTEIRSFMAFDVGFSGGVRVAAGDVNGDGLADIITGAGAGGGPHVKVFSATGGVLLNFMAFDARFSGGVTVAAGDINGDGRADVIVGALGGGPHVRAFSGFDGGLLRDFFAFDASFTGGVFVAAGDRNGDGVADIIVGAGPGGGPHVKVFDGQSGSETESFFVFEAQFSSGVQIQTLTADDGLTEIVLFQIDPPSFRFF